MQSQTKAENFQKFEKKTPHFPAKNKKAAPDKSKFFLPRVNFSGHIIEETTITPLKSRVIAISKLQPPSKSSKNFLDW